MLCGNEANPYTCVNYMAKGCRHSKDVQYKYRKISCNPLSPSAPNLQILSQKSLRRISAFLTWHSLSHLAVMDLVTLIS